MWNFQSRWVLGATVGLAGSRLAVMVAGCLMVAVLSAEAARPNILWITSEDHGPEMGAYGDKLATTPQVDRLAAKGIIYSRAWSSAPVCAPARTVLISGLYAQSTGSEHMRSMVPYPAGKAMFPQLLRQAGYYCSNNAKEDYNLAKPGQVWDASSRTAHWTNRAPGQPFFAVFNSEKSHESRLRARPHTPVHNPAQVRVAAYHPDTPEVRQDWAQYYDTVSLADADAGKRLLELEQAGLIDQTVVLYCGDHGSGMPRSKRWPYNSGLHVPLVVFIPETFKELRPPEYRPGGKSERLVSFVDMAPTFLSVAGIQPPDWLQGHAFLGKFAAPAQSFIHGFRGRMDERNDLVRSVTDGRYIYIRNYMPHLIYGQYIDYMFQTPATRVWHQLFEQGKLNPIQQKFWQRKPPEELYDLQGDPDEVNNLASSPEFAEIKARLRKAQQDLARSIMDLGFIPEGDRFARAGQQSPYDQARSTPNSAWVDLFQTAELASMLEPGAVPALNQALAHPDSAVRYWGALGLLMRGAPAVETSRQRLTEALQDPSPEVRIAAAEALGRFGIEADRATVLAVLAGYADWSKHSVFHALAALNALDALGQQAESVADAIWALPTTGPAPDARYDSYIPRLIERLRSRHPAPTTDRGPQPTPPIP